MYNTRKSVTNLHSSLHINGFNRMYAYRLKTKQLFLSKCLQSSPSLPEISLLFEMIVGVLTTCHKKTLERGVYSCTDGSRNSQSFLFWCALGVQFIKMAANGSEKAFCVLTFNECRSVTIVQQQFRTKFGKQPPSDNSIRRWYAQFQETECVCKRKRSGRLSVTEEQLEHVRQAFLRSPRKST